MDFATLIAATAVSLAWLRYAFGDFREFGEEFRESIAAVAAPPIDWESWSWAAYSICGLLMAVFAPFCWAWTVALLLLRLRQPRPRLRRLARQPGAIASHSAAIILVPAALILLCLAVVTVIEFESQQWESILRSSFVLVPALTGLVVLSAWATLLVGRRWRAESSWIDRAGRILGAYWISAIGLAFWAIV
jgi:hypothetical protein